jgi:hypothetical protein
MCAASQIVSNLPEAMWNTKGTPFVVMNDHLVLFIHLAKTGGTAIKSGYLPKDYFNHCHIPMSSIKERWPVMYAKSIKVASIRHPINRYCSIIRWFQGPKHKGGGPQINHDKIQACKTHEEEFAIFASGQLVNTHVKPSTWMLDLPQDIDYVIRQEHLQRDARQVFARFGMPSKEVRVVRPSYGHCEFHELPSNLKRMIEAHHRDEIEFYERLLLKHGLKPDAPRD